MIDADGYRKNIAIVIVNTVGLVMWCKRYGQSAWQFPQGGLVENETTEQGMYRELREETGLLPEHVKILGCSKDWLRYSFPENMIKKDRHFVGQKQIWFLLQLVADENNIKLDIMSQPEFDQWCWVRPEQAVQDVVGFKKAVYKSALDELAPFWPVECIMPSQGC